MASMFTVIEGKCQAGRFDHIPKDVEFVNMWWAEPCHAPATKQEDGTYLCDECKAYFDKHGKEWK
jgi:hypothetical protein